MSEPQSRRLFPDGALFSTGTRAEFTPSSEFVNVSLDYNASESGTARGTEVVIPDNASPEVRAAAERYNEAVVAFARANGIPDYPNRGVRTTSENGRGVSNTIHTEPFFNSDADMQRAIQANPQAFASIYSNTFGGISNARIIAPHGMGSDRGATSDFFGTETDFGRAMIQTILSGDAPTWNAPAQSGPAATQRLPGRAQAVTQAPLTITPDMIAQAFQSQQAAPVQPAFQQPAPAPMQQPASTGQGYQAPNDALARAMQSHQSLIQRRRGILNV